MSIAIQTKSAISSTIDYIKMWLSTLSSRQLSTPPGHDQSNVDLANSTHIAAWGCGGQMTMAVQQSAGMNLLQFLLIMVLNSSTRTQKGVLIKTSIAIQTKTAISSNIDCIKMWLSMLSSRRLSTPRDTINLMSILPTPHTSQFEAAVGKWPSLYNKVLEWTCCSSSWSRSSIPAQGLKKVC